MFKFLVLAVLLLGAGCQTAPQATAPQARPLPVPGIEQVSVRVVRYFNTYEVEALRSFMKTDGSNSPVVLSAPKVAGYPQKWLRTEAAMKVGGDARSTAFRLDGEMVELPVIPEAQLVTKVVPQNETTVRVLGVFAQAKTPGHGLDETIVCFDTVCAVGELSEVYRKTTTPDPGAAQ